MQAIIKKPEELLDSFIELQNTNLSKLSRNEIELLFYNKIGPFLHFSIHDNFLEPLTLFRILKYNTPYPELTRNDLSYPPPFIAKLNRANLQGFPVFYGCLTLQTCLFESNVKPGDIITIGRWTAANSDGMKLIPYLLHYKGRMDFFQTIAQKLLKSLIDSFEENPNQKYSKEYVIMLLKLLTESYLNNNLELSAYIAHASMYIANSANVIVYPSIATKREDVNFAIHPEYFDKKFILENVWIGIVKNVEINNCNVALMDMAGHEEDGKLIWTNNSLETWNKNIK